MGAASPALLQCPVTTPPVEPQAGDKSAQLAANPTGALACLTNEPASKRAAIGPGTAIPASVATVLARLIDTAMPADEATAERCAPTDPILLTRFDYSSGSVDVIVSSVCPARHVVYIGSRGYLLPALLSDFLPAGIEPESAGFTPRVMGLTLTAAAATARRSGDSLVLDGELLDASAAGTVLLQGPTLGHQIEVIAAVHRSAPCRDGQLAVQYLPGGAATGNDFGTIVLRNVSASWCELDGRASVTGLTAGRPVTSTVSIAGAAQLELSPRAAAAVPGRALAPDQLVASLSLSAAYRDDENGSLCARHWEVPEAWRVVLRSGALAVANGRGTADARPQGSGGLITCRGRFAASPMRTG
jgi:hypothetical protein